MDLHLQMLSETLISHQSRSVGYFLLPHHIPLTLWRHRGLIRQLVARSVASRYRGSVLGVLWSFLVPLLMLAVYTAVFSIGLKLTFKSEAGEGPIQFALMMFAGLVIYNVFAETVAGAASAIIGNVSYVKRVVFPLEILPVVMLGAALVNALASLMILLLGIGVFNHFFPFTLPWLLVVFVPLVMLCIGFGWFVASIGVYVRDVVHVIGIILQMLFFLTPLFYTVEQINNQMFQALMRVNPLTTLVESARLVLLLQRPPDWPWLLAVFAFSFVIMQLGYTWFMKTKRGFADVL